MKDVKMTETNVVLADEDVKACIDLDTRVQLKDGTYPVVIKVRQGDDKRFYRLGYSYTEQEFARLTENLSKEPYKSVWALFQDHLDRAEAVVKALMPCFSFSAFVERWKPKRTAKVVNDRSSLNYVLGLVVCDYMEADQLPSAVMLQQAVRSLLLFTKREDLPLKAITPKFCRDYEDYMYNKSKKKSRNGAGIYMRSIRILYNEAIRRGLVPREWYPFMRQDSEKTIYLKPYVIPNERTTKEYLNEKELIEFSEIDSFKNEAQKLGHLAWMISYHCNGANPADYLEFRFKDIVDNYLSFYRVKTKHTSKKSKILVKFFVTEELWDIIRAYGNEPLPDNYIFKCYKPGMTPEEKYKARKAFVSARTKSAKRAAKNAGIKKTVRIGNARHSIANVWKRNNLGREFVKDALGHASIKTSDNYLESFEDKKFEIVANEISSLKAIRKRVIQEQKQGE